MLYGHVPSVLVWWFVITVFRIVLGLGTLLLSAVLNLIFPALHLAWKSINSFVRNFVYL